MLSFHLGCKYCAISEISNKTGWDKCRDTEVLSSSYSNGPTGGAFFIPRCVCRAIEISTDGISEFLFTTVISPLVNCMQKCFCEALYTLIFLANRTGTLSVFATLGHMYGPAFLLPICIFKILSDIDKTPRGLAGLVRFVSITAHSIFPINC